ncbi:hypothetical protein BG011_002193 [Mortierella polycephala]|uniref:Uncharacterized protein n=1 Tax=Mortierella polycephala TaxID=41804 RepID=A0A9P6U5G8_9FUNG|nr:hypothetical protein BG011_002193 [Mortierella polycephala]
MAQVQSQSQAQIYTRIQAQFQSLLQSLGGFVHTLTHVYPHAKDLETIEQTCPHLKEIRFVLRNEGTVDKTALARFLMRMTDLEIVAFDAQTELQTSDMLYVLASYAQISSEATASGTGSAATNATGAHGQLRELEIKHTPGQSQQFQQNLALVQPHVQDIHATLTGQNDLSDHIPGSTLVTLHLDIGIQVADRGLRYLMTNCRSLRNLVLGIQYFSEWETASSATHSEESVMGTAFPPWACAGSLKELELGVVYWGHDSQMDMRIHAFIRRLADLKVLRRLIMPMKLVSDLSESHHQEYAAFRLRLDQLDQLARLQEQAQVQNAFAASSSNITATTPCTALQELALELQSSHSVTQLQQEQQQQQQQQHQPKKHAEEIWKRDGSGPVNFFPQMASVREVTLSSGARIGRVQMQMRYLHILMEAMPGLVTIQTGTELYGINFQSGFKQIQNRFMEMYGGMGVQLTMRFPLHSISVSAN